MTSVVLRNPTLPGQPIILDVAPGDFIPSIYKDSGWVVDSGTTVEDALVEAENTRTAASAAAAVRAAAFVPSFPPDDVPAEPVNTTKESAPVDSDAPKEN